MSMISVILLLLAQAAEPERVVLTGTIAGAAGKPAAGAEVVLAEGSPPLNELGGSTIRRTGAVLRPPAVLRRSRADADGRFGVGLPAEDVTIQRFRRPVFLWAFGPGGSVALRPIPDDWPPDGESVRLSLAPSELVRFRVLDPEEGPVAGARLVPARLRGVDVPVDLAGRFEVETDALGRGTLAAGAADELEVIRVISGPYGVQQLRVTRSDADGVRALRLLPVGRVVGQILAGDLQAVRGLTVRVRTDPDPSADVAGVGGWASVVTDDQGRFTVPAIAAGTLAVSVDLRWDLPWRSPLLSRPQVQPAATTEVTIPLKQAARIKGVVQEVPSGRPVAGVGVRVALDAETPLVPSDAEGRFSTYVLGMAVAYAFGKPRGYYSPSLRTNSQPVPEGVKELTIEPLGLSRGVEVRGQVLGAQGIPVPGADVSGHYDNANGNGWPIHAVTDREGRFRIESVPPDTTLHLSASRDRATTAAPESIPASKGSITLKISPENAVALYGRVEDAKGHPLAGAAVRVRARKRGRQDIPIEQLTISFDEEGRTTLHTDVNGQFRTPRQLRPDLEYRALVEADGYVAAGTEWIKPDALRQRYFAAVVLQPVAPTRTVAGRVVDGQGRPVAGAGVFQSGDGPARTRSVTDADGRFRLPGVYREPAFLFVEGDGLAFQGYRIEPRTDAIELKVRRAGDPPGSPLGTLPPAMPRDEEIALARRLIETDLTPLTGKQATSETMLLIRILPRLDLERALELADRKALPDPNYDDQLRLECAGALLRESPAEAAAIAETLKDAGLRSQFYREASDALPKTDRPGKLGLLDKALLHARVVPDPTGKLGELGMIGYRLLDLGETERGTQVLREGQRLAGTLPKFVAGQRNPVIAHARGRFAAKLARIDAKAAFGLAEGYSNPYDNWYTGGVALGLADRDPDGSERALGMLKNKGPRAGKVIRVAGRMAVIDRDRARRVTDTLERPGDQVLALGSMARGLAGSDPRAATALIDEAFGRLMKLVENGGERQSGAACLTAAEMLPLAEQLDPELLRRCFWRAVALRPPRPAGSDPRFAYEQAVSSLAITLGRYDRTVARQILEPAALRVRSLDYSRRSWAHRLFAAATVIDPAWAVALADSLPDDRPGADLHPKTSIRRVIADVLAHGGPDRWDYFERPEVGYYLSGRPRDSKDDER